MNYLLMDMIVALLVGVAYFSAGLAVGYALALWYRDRQTERNHGPR